MAPPTPTRNTDDNTRNSTAMMGSRLERLSLQFPPSRPNPNHTATLPYPNPSPIAQDFKSTKVPDQSLSCNGPPPVALDSNAFLTALAAQERKVLELREELHKAELDLEKFKKQWAQYETTKKKHEIRHVEPLRLLAVSPKIAVTPYASRPRAETENGGASQINISERSISNGNGLVNEKSRAAHHYRKRPIQRKVFSGSKHTRALSLLLPKNIYQERPSDQGLSRDPSPTKAPITTVETHTSLDTSRPNALLNVERSNLRKPGTEMPPFSRTTSFPTEDIVNTGKQFVGDLREGLWTFFEDIRQATVGEEATRSQQIAQSIEKKPSRQRLALGNTSSSIMKRGSGKDHGSSPARSARAVSGTRKPNPLSICRDGNSMIATDTSKGSVSSKILQELAPEPPVDLLNDDDGWGNWESPAPSKKSSPSWKTTSYHHHTNSDSPSANESTPRTSLSSIENTLKPFSGEKEAGRGLQQPSGSNDELPWPVLVKISPSNLRRTASNMMSEWEKSLLSDVEKTSPQANAAGEKVQKLD
ncbi:hypothetical protein MMC25_008009 [Agyrium rufum]|nr:hypothetical protein [Agyrium rufum]